MDRPLSKTTRLANTRDKQMVKGKPNNTSNRKQGYLATSEPSTPTTASPGHLNKPENQDSDIKSYLMKMIEDLKEDIYNSKEYRRTQVNR